MKEKRFDIEAAGSLTPELEGMPSSGPHKKRTAKPNESGPDNKWHVSQHPDQQPGTWQPVKKEPQSGK